MELASEIPEIDIIMGGHNHIKRREVGNQN